ncbi:MAG: type I 3-dehydroquinate dehydratase [Chlamydiia bacterium]|nr:type I 3-dehydroquinate dehydratase [Chlamydiia bacterium]
MGQIATTLIHPCIELEQSDLYEIRCDLVDPSFFCLGSPVIYTDPDASEARLCELAALGPDYLTIDGTHTCFEKLKKTYPNVKLIAAIHDFDKTPENLISLFEMLDQLPVDCIKIATWARSSLDALRMLQTVKQFKTEKKIIGLCMGPLGEVTRILAPLFGSSWTYAAPKLGEEGAPGQLTIGELRTIYRYNTLSSKTLLYGLIGDPISHSLSHISHNALFDRLGVDGVYVKLCVKKEEVKTFLPFAFSLGFLGFSVTMPLKECVGEFLGREAVNTVSNQYRGWNTDGEGAVWVIDFKEKTVVVIGAGGVAVGIARAAYAQGAKLIIVNRTFERAVVLAKKVEGEAFALENFSEITKKKYDIVINATSQDDPVPYFFPLRGTLVVDVNNRPSPFLQKAVGCRTVSGKEIFMHQAACQFQHWMGYDRCIIKELFEEILCG